MRARSLSALPLVAVFLLQGCASVEGLLPRGKARSRDNEIRELRTRVVELQKRATMAEVELEHLKKKLAEAEKGQVAPSPQPATEPAEIVEISEAGEVIGSRGATSQPRSSAAAAIEVIDLDSPPAGVRPPATAQPPVRERPSEMPGDPPVTVLEDAAETPLRKVSPEGQALYDLGYTHYHQGRYLDAETAFQRFLGEFAGSDLGDNAQFWIGEARFARGDLAGALAAYREVARRYPAGNKVADSMLKAADCLRGLGDLDGARQNYQTVIDRYPSAAAAAVAEDRLRDLD